MFRKRLDVKISEGPNKKIQAVTAVTWLNGDWYSFQDRPVGTGGVRGARAPPIFWGQRNKIYLEFCPFAWLLSVVHPLILAACYGPDHCLIILKI